MPTIGYCHDCSLWVHVRPDWSCPSGHPAARVNGWYDSETGDAVVPSPRSSPAAAAAAPGTRAAFLTDLMSTLSEDRAYCAGWGPDTDVIIASNPVDPSWGIGDEREEYVAALKAVEADRTVYFWELLKRRGDDSTLDVFDADPDTSTEASSPGAQGAMSIGPGSVSWEWGFGTLRGVVEEVAVRNGFQLRTVLNRQAAAW